MEFIIVDDLSGVVLLDVYKQNARRKQKSDVIIYRHLFGTYLHDHIKICPKYWRGMSD